MPFAIRAAKRLYLESLKIYYHPRDLLSRSYVDYQFNRGVRYLSVALKEFDDIIENRHDLYRNDFEKELYRLDYILSFLFYGMEDRDYFSLMLRGSNPKIRNHFISRRRLFFARFIANDLDVLHCTTNKNEFAEIWSEEYGRAWALVPDCSKEEFCEKFKDFKRIIAKPYNGMCGDDIEAFDIDNNLPEIYDYLKEKGEKNGGRKYLTEEYLFQKGFLHKVNPSSLNTVRIVTLRYPWGVKIIYSFFRAGSEGSAVDNYCAGGTLFDVDINSGVLKEGVSPYGEVRTCHPDTGVKITGEKIPSWDRIKETCIKAQLKAPKGLDFLGWDVALLDDDGRICLVESNNSPGFWFVGKRDDNWGDLLELIREWHKDKNIENGYEHVMQNC